MKKGIAFAGNIIIDYVKLIDAYPAEQSLTTIRDMKPSLGGLCCNCVLTLAKLDPELPIKVIGIIGEDDAGDFAMSSFGKHASVDTSRILRQGHTSYTDVMTVTSTSKRTFFTYQGANALLKPEHFDFSALDADILHIGYILLLDGLDAPDEDYPTAMCRVLDAAQKAGIRTSIDVVSEEGERFAKLVTPALKYADYCIINEYEASLTVGIPVRDAGGNLIEENLPVICQKLMDMGVGRWVVVHMQELSCGLERGGVYYQENSWEIPEGFKKSSVGAGDAYAGGILYGIYNDWSLEESINTAGAVAAYSLSGVGAYDPIKPLPELIKEMKTFQ